MKSRFAGIKALVLAACGLVFLASLALAQSPYPGWEKGGEYDSNYKVSEYDSFKGKITDILTITPLPGMHPGIGLMIHDREGEDIVVHLGPKGFLDPNNLRLRKGDSVKVKGVWAEIDGREIFMASKVKRSEYDEVKVRRTRDGMPFWSMTPEELAREQE